MHISNKEVSLYVQGYLAGIVVPWKKGVYLVFFLIRLLVLYSKAQFFSEWWVLYREAIKCFRICGGGTPQWSKIGKKIVAFMITSRAKINVFLK